MLRKPETELRRGWTTGACATAATKAAYQALLTGDFPDPVTITLPRGQQPAFALARTWLGADSASAAIIKDGGDDPDVTHGVLIIAKISRAAAGSGVVFRAGPGVGTVTKPGLPIAPGEAAINPVPRQLMTAVIGELAQQYGDRGDIEIEISIPDGENIARKTWNPRLGIVGGLSVLGTTGIVIPYSCSAWIHSIQRGIDVARASGQTHVAGCTGSTSERVVRALYSLPESAMLDMGDFAGGMLKYLRRHPIAKLSIGGGFAKLSKLAMGYLDLHSGRSQVDFNWLAQRALELGASDDLAEQIRVANTANQVLQLSQQAGLAMADLVAERAMATALEVLRNPEIQVDVVVVDRGGQIIGRSTQ